jgi:ribonuclease HI
MAHCPDYAVIYSDSQNAIASLQNPGNRNPIIREVLTIAASLNIPVYITWVKKHSGVAGNERADKLAKKPLHHPSQSATVLCPSQQHD